MNVARILSLANYIEVSPVFNMRQWRHCIAGHLFEQDHQQHHRSSMMWFDGVSVGMARHVATELDIDIRSAYNLILPRETYMDQCTKFDAARVLRELAITGKVNWDDIMDPPMPSLPVIKDRSSIVAASLRFFAEQFTV